MDLKTVQLLEFINNRLSNIESNIQRIDEKLDYSLAIQRNHLIRIKNGQELDDSTILMGRPYNDLTSARAYQIYCNPDMDFMVLDVCSDTGYDSEAIPTALHIPLEDLNHRYAEIRNKTCPILVISEVGLRSIQACELLVKKGFFNVNNVSGGYKFWPKEAGPEKTQNA
jgi:rhodanese-related sulfurtransferase